jgi:peptide/nickel transport system substrate-binding protein
MKRKIDINMGLLLGITVLLLIALPLLSSQAAAKAKPQGTLTIAIGSLGEEGFLPDMGTLEQGHAWDPVYEFPYYLGVKMSGVQPGLVERFEYSKDGLTITMHLRKGVPWHDTQKWGEVTAEDVKYSYERIMRKESTSIVKAILRRQVKSIEIVDRLTVNLHLKELAPEFWVQIFGLANQAAPILCKKYVETVGEDKARSHPIGSGPFRLVEHKAGDYMKFEALDEHWRVVPEFKQVILRIVPEETTRVAMLKTGEVDIALITAQSMADLEKAPGITVELWPGGDSILGCFGGLVPPNDPHYKEGYHHKDPWVDQRVREAMCIAIDREGIVKAVYKGAAKAMTIGWPMPGWEDLPPVPYDPERAKRLLAEAGYPDGFELKVVATSGWFPAYEMPQVMEAVAAYFEAIGLKVKIVPLEKAEIRRINRAYKDAGMIYPWRESFKVSWAGRHLTKFVPGGEPVLFSSDEITDLVNKYEVETDPEKRVARLKAISDYRYKHKVTIPIVNIPRVYAFRNKVVGEWPQTVSTGKNHMISYIRHAKPLNTWRLFTP